LTEITEIFARAHVAAGAVIRRVTLPITSGIFPQSWPNTASISALPALNSTSGSPARRYEPHQPSARAAPVPANSAMVTSLPPSEPLSWCWPCRGAK
jgi:hypothetical protein